MFDGENQEEPGGKFYKSFSINFYTICIETFLFSVFLFSVFLLVIFVCPFFFICFKCAQKGAAHFTAMYYYIYIYIFLSFFYFCYHKFSFLKNVNSWIKKFREKIMRKYMENLRKIARSITNWRMNIDVPISKLFSLLSFFSVYLHVWCIN